MAMHRERHMMFERRDEQRPRGEVGRSVGTKSWLIAGWGSTIGGNDVTRPALSMR
jgi:hypothetical protein